MKKTFYAREYEYVQRNHRMEYNEKEDYAIGWCLVRECHDIGPYQFFWDENGLFSIKLSLESCNRGRYQRLITISSQQNQDPPQDLLKLLAENSFTKIEPPKNPENS